MTTDTQQTEAPASHAPLIYPAMAAILAEVRAVGKTRTNEQQGYSFRGIDDFLNAMHGLMAKHGVFVTPDYEVLQEWQEQSRHGTTMSCVRIRGRFTFYARDGSSVEAQALGEGKDTSDKASYKAESGAFKYVLAQAFCVPTGDAVDPEDDSLPNGQRIYPDGTRSHPRNGPPKEQQAPKPNTPAARNSTPGTPSILTQKAALLGAVAKALNLRLSTPDGKAEAQRLIAQARDQLGADSNTADGIQAIREHLTVEVPRAKAELLQAVETALQTDKAGAVEAIRDAARKLAADTNELPGIEAIKTELTSD